MSVQPEVGCDQSEARFRPPLERIALSDEHLQADSREKRLAGIDGFHGIGLSSGGLGAHVGSAMIGAPALAIANVTARTGASAVAFRLFRLAYEAHRGNR